MNEEQKQTQQLEGSAQVTESASPADRADARSQSRDALSAIEEIMAVVPNAIYSRSVVSNEELRGDEVDSLLSALTPSVITRPESVDYVAMPVETASVAVSDKLHLVLEALPRGSARAQMIRREDVTPLVSDVSRAQILHRLAILQEPSLVSPALAEYLASSPEVARELAMIAKRSTTKMREKLDSIVRKRKSFLPYTLRAVDARNTSTALTLLSYAWRNVDNECAKEDTVFYAVSGALASLANVILASLPTVRTQAVEEISVRWATKESTDGIAKALSSRDFSALISLARTNIASSADPTRASDYARIVDACEHVLVTACFDAAVAQNGLRADAFSAGVLSGSATDAALLCLADMIYARLVRVTDIEESEYATLYWFDLSAELVSLADKVAKIDVTAIPTKLCVDWWVGSQQQYSATTPTEEALSAARVDSSLSYVFSTWSAQQGKRLLQDKAVTDLYASDGEIPAYTVKGDRADSTRRSIIEDFVDEITIRAVSYSIGSVTSDFVAAVDEVYESVESLVDDWSSALSRARSLSAAEVGVKLRSDILNILSRFKLASFVMTPASPASARIVATYDRLCNIFAGRTKSLMQLSEEVADSRMMSLPMQISTLTTLDITGDLNVGFDELVVQEGSAAAAVLGTAERVEDDTFKPSSVALLTSLIERLVDLANTSSSTSLSEESKRVCDAMARRTFRSIVAWAFLKPAARREVASFRGKFIFDALMRSLSQSQLAEIGSSVDELSSAISFMLICKNCARNTALALTLADAAAQLAVTLSVPEPFKDAAQCFVDEYTEVVTSDACTRFSKAVAKLLESFDGVVPFDMTKHVSQLVAHYASLRLARYQSSADVVRDVTDARALVANNQLASRVERASYALSRHLVHDVKGDVYAVSELRDIAVQPYVSTFASVFELESAGLDVSLVPMSASGRSNARLASQVVGLINSHRDIVAEAIRKAQVAEVVDPLGMTRSRYSIPLAVVQRKNVVERSLSGFVASLIDVIDASNRSLGFVQFTDTLREPNAQDEVLAQFCRICASPSDAIVLGGQVDIITERRGATERDIDIVLQRLNLTSETLVSADLAWRIVDLVNGALRRSNASKLRGDVFFPAPLQAVPADLRTAIEASRKGLGLKDYVKLGAFLKLTSSARMDKTAVGTFTYTIMTQPIDLNVRDLLLSTGNPGTTVKFSLVKEGSFGIELRSVSTEQLRLLAMLTSRTGSPSLSQGLARDMANDVLIALTRQVFNIMRADDVAVGTPLIR